jgi:hypothetical protein
MQTKWDRLTHDDIGVRYRKSFDLKSGGMTMVWKDGKGRAAFIYGTPPVTLPDAPLANHSAQVTSERCERISAPLEHIYDA